MKKERKFKEEKYFPSHPSSLSLSLLYFHDDNNSDIYGDCKKKKKKKKELFHASSRQRRNIVYKRNCFIGAAFFSKNSEFH